MPRSLLASLTSVELGRGWVRVEVEVEVEMEMRLCHGGYVSTMLCWVVRVGDLSLGRRSINERIGFNETARHCIPLLHGTASLAAAAVTAPDLTLGEGETRRDGTERTFGDGWVGG